jgi:GWxTD domain-containing protein
MTKQTRRRWLSVLVASLLVLATVPASASEWEEPSKKWVKGPVSYIVTDEEEKEFKKLGSDEEREAFIEAFWARRDPHPDGPGNEFRDRFYARVDAADKALREQGNPAGWKSDLARVLVLLGQPDNVSQSAAPGAQGGGPVADSGPSYYSNPGDAAPQAAAGQGGILTFSYPDLSVLGLPENLEIQFQQEGLVYRLLTRVDLATAAIRGLDREALLQEFPEGAAPVEEKLTLNPEAPQAPTVPSAVPAAGEISVQRRVLEELLDAGTGREELPAEVALDLYKAINDRTYVAVTVGISEAALGEAGLTPGDLHPVAALRDVEQPEDPDGYFLYDSDELFAPAEDGGADGILRFQAGDGVPPGTYEVVAGFVTGDGEKVGCTVEEIEVPDFTAAGVQLSSLTLATLLETTDQAEGDLKVPYILGNRKVVPRVDTNYPLNGTLTLYYQVYNAGEQGGHPNLRVSYNFYQKRGSRYIKAGTAPPADGVQDRVIIYELPLQGWPKGSYKIKVTVEDNVNGSFAEREIPFEVG